MKVKTNDTNEFKPFDITITIESIDDLKHLYHRLNVYLQRNSEGIISFKEYGSNDYSDFKPNNEIDRDLYHLILEKLNELEK